MRTRVIAGSGGVAIYGAVGPRVHLRIWRSALAGREEGPFICRASVNGPT